MKGMGNIQNMLQQAKKMQEKMQQELSEMRGLLPGMSRVKRLE